MFQIVHRGAEYEEDRLVEGAFAYFTGGYLRVEVPPAEGSRPGERAARR